jgi:NAD+ diphosphatase
MIQNILPKKFNNSYGLHEAESADFVMIFKNNQVLVKKENGKVCLPHFKDLEKYDIDVYQNQQYLFAVDDEKFFLADDIDLSFVDNVKWRLENQTVFRGIIDGYEAYGGITAAQLYRWYRDNKFCGGCGGRMQPGSKERSLICTNCGKVIYPRINPAVIIAVTDGDRLLMTQYAGRDYKRYALVAGFVEVGETFEETVIREVKEEVGLKVKNVRYFGSQPWSFSDSVMIAFFAELDGDDKITLQREELDVAKWFHKDEIPADMHPISIGYDLVQSFIEGKIED